MLSSKFLSSGLRASIIFIVSGLILVGCGLLGTDPPSPPGDVQLSASQSGVDISWSGSSNATGYNIYRSEDSLSDGISGLSPLNGETPIENSEFKDEGAENSTEYFYRVSAVNKGGESDPSSMKSVQMPYPEPPNKPE